MCSGISYNLFRIFCALGVQDLLDFDVETIKNSGGTRYTVIPRTTKLTADQIKQAAVRMIVNIFGKEYSNPRKIMVSEFNVVVIYGDPSGDTMEPYFLKGGGEFAFSRASDGKIAEVDIYTLDLLESYL